jgi:broad specificity phosphatase PhoE
VKNPEIILIRHGRSAHVETGWIDLDGFHRWREAYEAAGILPTEVPPDAVRQMARRAGVVAASTSPRAIESARLLAEGREVITSPLLVERVPVPPSLRLRLPLAGWALAYGIQWLFRALTSRPHAPEAEITRAREAAEWLTDLARQHGAVAVVTHASFRALLTRTLMAEGWRGDGARRRSQNWSAWRLTR